MVIDQVAPYPHAEPGAYALVGMGALFAGIVRAPITSVFMIFEITQDYQILVPLMVANLLSFTISRKYQRVPVYDALLRQDRIHLPRVALPGNMSRSARDVMRRDMALFNPQSSVDAALTRFAAESRSAVLVGTATRVEGVVTIDELVAASSEGRGSLPIQSVTDGDFIHVHPDHPLDLVIERLAETPGILPVVSREDTRRVEGIITPDDLALAARPRRRPKMG